MKGKIVVSIVLVLIIFSSCKQTQEHNTEVWLCPSANKILHLANNNWDAQGNGISGVKLYIGFIKKAQEKDLRKLAFWIDENNLQVSLECAGTINPDWQDEAGEKSALITSNVIKKYEKTGGRIDYLDLDGPMRRLLGFPLRIRRPDMQFFTDYQRCSEELIDFMDETKKLHPEMGFFLLVNFPNWGYKGEISYHARGENQQDFGDYFEVVSTLMNSLENTGHRFDAVTIDNPYEYLTGEKESAKNTQPDTVNWIGRLRDYEDFTRQNNMKFNLIINSETGGKTSDTLFYEKTREMINFYKEAGGMPDRIYLQSWYRYPSRMLPDTAEYTFTALAKDIVELVNNQP